MHFDTDAFISYAHLDDVALVEGHKGWVANFHRALEVRIGQLLGKPPDIWRDPKLTGNDLFAESLVARLQHVALLVIVVTPRYLKSEWTIRELNVFWRGVQDQGDLHIDNKARVFKVLKTPVALDRTPPELQRLLGYEFFKVDPETGRVHELDDVFGPEAQRDFWLKLDDLAHDIVALLDAMKASETTSATSSEAPALSTAAAVQSPAGPDPPATRVGAKRVVYLAETTNDLREQREAIRRDLQQRGHTVLPDRTIPHVFEDATAAIVEDLARSDMSVHPIGRNYGLVPEGGHHSMLEMQHELATIRAGDGNFARLLWIPSGLSVEDPRQQKVIEQLRMDPRIEGNADLLETCFEDLRTMMQDWLEKDRTVVAAPEAEPAADAAQATAPVLYLLADQRDAGLLASWGDEFFAQGLDVIQPVLDGDEAELRQYHEENLAHCDGVLVLYGSGNELWVRRKLREVQKSAGYGRTKPPPPAVICLVGPRTPEKERFRTHDATVVPAWDGVDLEGLGPFILRLKTSGSV